MRASKETFNFKKFSDPIVIYGVISFFLGLGDALMSYAAPVYIEAVMKNPFLMGLVFSTSSIFGLFLDIFTDKFIPNGTYRKYLKIVFLTTVAFPLSLLLLPPTITVLIVGMIFWGTYYEFKGFSSYSFIHKFSEFDKHTTSWSILSAFGSIAYLIGPSIAVLLIDRNIKYVFVAALIPFVFAYVIYMLFRRYKDKNKERKIYINEKEIRSTKDQLKISFTLLKRIWPLFIFTATLYLIDSAFWTIGILFTEELKGQSFWGSLFLPAYMAPSIFIGLIAPKIHKHFGKKRTSFIAAVASGLLLIFVGASNNTIFIVLSVFIMSIFLSISSILNTAVFEDYVARLGKFGNDMAGIEQASGSLAYIIGPIMWGGLASLLGYHRSFALTGVIFASISVACLAAVPRKIKMPQTDLNHVVSIA